MHAFSTTILCTSLAVPAIRFIDPNPNKDPYPGITIYRHLDLTRTPSKLPIQPKRNHLYTKNLYGNQAAYPCLVHIHFGPLNSQQDTDGASQYNVQRFTKRQR